MSSIYTEKYAVKRQNLIYAEAMHCLPPLPTCPYEHGTYAADRWTHQMSAQRLGLKGPLSALDDRGTGSTDAATAKRLKAEGKTKPRSLRGAAAGELIKELRPFERHHGLLVFVTVNHPQQLDARSLTDGHGTEWMEATLRRLAPEGYARLEHGGRSTGLHFHALLSLGLLDMAEVARLRAEGYNIDIRLADLEQDAMYLTKSPDSRTAMTNYHRHLDPAEVLAAYRDHLAGLEDYRRRTGKRQAPARQGWLGGRPSSRGLASSWHDDHLLTPVDDSHVYGVAADPYTDRDAEELARLAEMEALSYEPAHEAATTQERRPRPDEGATSQNPGRAAGLIRAALQVGARYAQRRSQNGRRRPAPAVPILAFSGFRRAGQPTGAQAVTYCGGKSTFWQSHSHHFDGRKARIMMLLRISLAG